MPQFIYVIGPVDGPVKIGKGRDPYARLIACQVGNHLQLHVHGMFKVDAEHDVSSVERHIHARLPNHIRGEWFDMPPAEAVHEVKAMVGGYVPHSRKEEVVRLLEDTLAKALA